MRALEWTCGNAQATGKDAIPTTIENLIHLSRKLNSCTSSVDSSQFTFQRRKTTVHNFPRQLRAFTRRSKRGCWQDLRRLRSDQPCSSGHFRYSHTSLSPLDPSGSPRPGPRSAGRPRCWRSSGHRRSRCPSPSRSVSGSRSKARWCHQESNLALRLSMSPELWRSVNGINRRHLGQHENVVRVFKPKLLLAASGSTATSLKVEAKRYRRVSN